MYAQPKQGTEHKTYSKMPAVRRKDRKFDPPGITLHHLETEFHNPPQTGLIRSLAIAIEQANQWHQTRLGVCCGKFKVDWQAGQCAGANIIRVAFYAAPSTHLGLKQRAEFSRSRIDGNILQDA